MIKKIKKALLNYRKRFNTEINYIEMKELLKQNENVRINVLNALKGNL